MGKYNQIPLKPVKARKEFICYSCHSAIKSQDIYYIQKDKFLQTLKGKRFCSKCFKKTGQSLLQIKKQDKSQRKLS